MGNTENWVSDTRGFPSEQQLLTSLIPIEDGQDDNQMLSLGRFKIFRFRVEPYEIVMKHVRTFSGSHPKLQEFEEGTAGMGGGRLDHSKVSHLDSSSQHNYGKHSQHMGMARLDHKNIAKVHSVNICRRSNICTEQVAIESYVNYYAIDLQTLIEQRKTTDSRIAPQEVWYLLKSLLELSLYLQELGLYFGVYLAKNVYLSPEGYLKVYLFHCTPAEQLPTHLLYYHAAASDSRDLHKFLPLPPECLPMLQKRAQTIGQLDKEKMDVFGIGMLALEAMLFNPTRRYYLNDSGEGLSFDGKQLQLDFQELRQVYPSDLVDLVEGMTKERPEERTGFTGGLSHIKAVRQHISISGSIRMLDQETSSVPKLSYKLASSNCQDVLSSISFNSNRLECFPLQTVDKVDKGKGEKRTDNEKEKGKGKENCIVEHLPPSMRQSRPRGLNCSRGMKNSKLQLSGLGREAIR